MIHRKIKDTTSDRFLERIIAHKNDEAEEMFETIMKRKTNKSIPKGTLPPPQDVTNDLLRDILSALQKDAELTTEPFESVNDQLKSIRKEIEELAVRIKRLEANPSQELHDIKRSLEELKRIKSPMEGDQWGPSIITTCRVCGINMNNLNYFCNRTNCPNYGYTTCETTTSSSCACGANKTCICNNSC